MADDLLKKLGSGFSLVGKRLRDGATELKKTAGIGVGSLAIELDRFSFRPGDLVSGKIVLALEEPTEAKRVVVSLIGTRERIEYERDSAGRKQQTRHNETLCEVERELGGAGVYRDQTYEFSLMIPTDDKSAPRPAGDGVIGDVARVIHAVSNASLLPTSWRVVAWLDIPWKRNVKKHVDIQVRTD